MVAPFYFRPAHKVDRPRVDFVILNVGRAGRPRATRKRPAAYPAIVEVDRKIPNRLGDVYCAQGDYTRALDYYQRSLKLLFLERHR
jgi:tetratricopeptide (TPR) repeat protein